MPTSSVSDGQMYAFQLPILASDLLFVTPVGPANRSFQSGLAPVLANGGLNWSVARSEIRCWAGTEDLVRRSFDQGALANVGYARGNPSLSTASAQPIVTAGSDPMIYGPGAANQIFRLNADCSDATDVYTFTDSATVLTNKILCPSTRRLLTLALLRAICSRLTP